MDISTAHDLCLIQANIKNVGLFWSASCVVEIAYAAKGYFPKNKVLQKLCGLSVFLKSVTNAYFKRSTTVIALTGKEVVGTLAVYQQNWRLPVDNLFPCEVKRLRKTGAKIIYIGTFATSEEFRGKAILASSLFEEAVKMSREGHATHALCVVHPSHVKIYRRLGFTEIARKENMPGLNNAPAVLLQLDTATLKSDVMHRMAKI